MAKRYEKNLKIFTKTKYYDKFGKNKIRIQDKVKEILQKNGFRAVRRRIPRSRNNAYQYEIEKIIIIYFGILFIVQRYPPCLAYF